VLGDAGEKLGGPMLDSLTDFAEAARDFIEQADFAAWGAGVANALKQAMEAITAWRKFVAEGEEAPGAGQQMFGPTTAADIARQRGRPIGGATTPLWDIINQAVTSGIGAISTAETGLARGAGRGAFAGAGARGGGGAEIPTIAGWAKAFRGEGESMRQGASTKQETAAAQAKRDAYLKEQTELLKRQIKVQEEMLFGINDLKDLTLYQ